MVAISYLISPRSAAGAPLTPEIVAVLLVANLVPAMALMVMVARRLAIRRVGAIGAGAEEPPPGAAGRDLLGDRQRADFAGGDLRLLAVPDMAWNSGPRTARAPCWRMRQPRQENYNRELDRVGLEAAAMSGDLSRYLQQVPIDSTTFAELFGRQVFERNLSEAIIFRVAPDNSIQSLALVDPYDRSLETVVTPQMIAGVRPQSPSIIVSDDRFAAITVLPYGENSYLYTARVFEPELASQLRRGAAVLEDYRTLVNRSRNLQLRFNAALFALSLLIVASRRIALR